MKSCYLCRVPRPLSDFYPNQARSSGLASCCKTCSKFSTKVSQLHLSHRFTQEDFEGMRWLQDNRCAVCSADFQQPCIDHDHVTGKVRGLVCHGCNLMLGHAKDNPSRLLAGARYLAVG